MRRGWAVAAISVVLVLLAPQAALGRPLVRSLFNSSNEGWTWFIPGTGTGSADWDATVGHPAGSISKDVGGQSAFFIDWTGTKFGGNRVAAFHGRLTFDAARNLSGSGFAAQPPAVAILFAGPLQLEHDFAQDMTTTGGWTHFAVPMRPSRWIDLSTNMTATGAQLRSALRHLTDLQIEFEEAGTVTTGKYFLDNVKLLSP